MNSYDTLSEMGQLEESGMKRSKAEAVVNSIKAAVAPLATSAELGETRKELGELREELVETRKELRKEIAETRKELRKDFREELAETRKELRKEMATKTDLAEMKYEVLKQTSALISQLFWRQATLALAIAGIVLTYLHYFPLA